MPQWEYCSLVHDENEIVYLLYYVTGMWHENRPFTPDLWAWCIATLGLQGWEAVNINNPTDEHGWSFKRKTDSRNQPFNFP